MISLDGIEFNDEDRVLQLLLAILSYFAYKNLKRAARPVVTEEISTQMEQPPAYVEEFGKMSQFRVSRLSQSSSDSLVKK